jgi:hypothetical protein
MIGYRSTADLGTGVDFLSIINRLDQTIGKARIIFKRHNKELYPLYFDFSINVCIRVFKFVFQVLKD